ncbi:uncharacterized protein SAPINGB_P004704 [Magnusiomyces paraingens]|uniref:Jacalin-type lectin domain-containing protein n=1 Tax=Magnusiomyces paraingens TaxID=2606893 RepID=A0A5E8C1A2_9ASCO|nr:uncharacterized protein SAPINGB_P004704 [Saprochaete ingens]VVT55720.1 unnamed protein product [Saprochaete ingens]
MHFHRRHKHKKSNSSSSSSSSSSNSSSSSDDESHAVPVYKNKPLSPTPPVKSRSYPPQPPKHPYVRPQHPSVDVSYKDKIRSTFGRDIGLITSYCSDLDDNIPGAEKEVGYIPANISEVIIRNGHFIDSIEFVPYQKSRSSIYKVGGNGGDEYRFQFEKDEHLAGFHLRSSKGRLSSLQILTDRRQSPIYGRTDLDEDEEYNLIHLAGYQIVGMRAFVKGWITSFSIIYASNNELFRSRFTEYEVQQYILRNPVMHSYMRVLDGVVAGNSSSFHGESTGYLEMAIIPPNLKSVNIQSGLYVDGFEFITGAKGDDYEDQSYWIKAGGFGGHYNRFELMDGEYIVGFAGKVDDFLQNIQIITNFRKSPVYGESEDGDSFEIRAPYGQELVGIKTYYDSWINAISLVCTTNTHLAQSQGQELILKQQSDLNTIQHSFYYNCGTLTATCSPFYGEKSGELQISAIPPFIHGVNIRSGRYVDGIEFILPQDSGAAHNGPSRPRIGGMGGHDNQFFLEEGEYIVGFRIKVGNHLNLCQLVTNRRTGPPCGEDDSGKWHEVITPQGTRLVGIRGHFDDWLKSLSIIYVPKDQITIN